MPGISKSSVYNYILSLYFQKKEERKLKHSLTASTQGSVWEVQDLSKVITKDSLEVVAKPEREAEPIT